MSDKMNINVKVGSNTYSLRITPEREELVRAAAKEVDRRYNDFLERSKDIGNIRAMTMAAIDLAVDYMTAMDLNDTQPYADKIKELSKKIETYIQKGE